MREVRNLESLGPGQTDDAAGRMLRGYFFAQGAICNLRVCNSGDVGEITVLSCLSFRAQRYPPNAPRSAMASLPSNNESLRELVPRTGLRETLIKVCDFHWDSV